MGEWLLALVLVLGGGGWVFALGYWKGQYDAGGPAECVRKHRDEL